MNIIVTAAAGAARHRGRLRAGGREWDCALGRNGIAANKREGDGASPAGNFVLREVLYRADRVARPATRLPCRAIDRDDGWCDDPAHPDYNRPVRFPFAAGAERMWRDDRLYDLIVVVGYNDAPPRPGLGSAIFMHAARDDLGPTEGCVALPQDRLAELVAALAPGDTITIGAARTDVA